jgi:hypothetical protein
MGPKISAMATVRYSNFSRALLCMCAVHLLIELERNKQRVEGEGAFTPDLWPI